MKRVLVLFAHPTFRKSRINKKLIEAIENMDGVTVNNLYENYPDFFIDVKKEQKLLLAHDIIIWQHPFYWYSAPAILKEWMDLVLGHGFAYGNNGKALAGKIIFSAISTGAKKESYSNDGGNQFTINQFLTPFKQSANLCRMTYLPPFVVHGSYSASEKEIENYGKMYRNLIEMLRDEKVGSTELKLKEYSNNLFE